MVPQDYLQISYSDLFISVKQNGQATGQVQSWEVVAMTPNQLQIQITWVNAVQLTSQDQLEIKILNNALFIEQANGEAIKKTTTLLKTIPT